MFGYKWLLTFAFLIVVPVSLLAQTASEMRDRYKISSRVESYDVRPGIIATVFYGAEGNVVSIDLNPPVDYREARTKKNEMPMNAVQEVLNELVPLAKRGAVCGDYGASGSIYALHRRVDYENVSISSVTRGDKAARHVFIEFTKCAGKLQP